MTSYSDTLEIGGLRSRSGLPLAAVEAATEATANHPEAAAAARARIAALPDTLPLTDPVNLPTTPTAELVTNRDTLASHYRPTPAVARRRTLPPATRPILTAVGIFALMLLLFKSPIIFSQASYSLNKPAPTATVAPAADSVIPADPTITIPKINVHAPVVYEPSVVEANVQKALEGGVVHYGNTPAPGQAGNSVIFGHSSNDWWEPGDFKFVFVLLDKLAPGDRFTVDYQRVRYTYEVTGSKVVEPTDLSVLAATSEPTMTLITCTPPGTSWKRLVVTAKQVDPAPGAATNPTPAPGSQASANLPGAAPSFWDQVGQGWNGIVHGFSALFGGDKAPADSSTNTQASPDSLPAIK